MSRHHIQIDHFPTSQPSPRGHLLFVHGAYTHSKYWHFNFIPFFRKHGYHCHTVDLSGHGASAGHEQLDNFGIDDYAKDIAEASARIGQPLTIIAHSMGCLATQRYLERGDAQSAILLAPVPSTGTGGSAAQLAMRYPLYFSAMDEIVNGVFTPENNDLMAKIYFAPDASSDEVAEFLPTIGPESQKAILEMALLPVRPPQRRKKIPALIIGGEQDSIFPPSHLYFTALPWQADIIRVAGAGHMLPIDRQWQTTAQHILDWLPAQ